MFLLPGAKPVIFVWGAKVKLSYWFVIQEKCKPQHTIYIHTCLHALVKKKKKLNPKYKS